VAVSDGSRAPVLEVRDLRIDFDTPTGSVKAVRGVSFEVAPGETLGIVGESGCGKTATLLGCLRLLPEPPARVVAGQALLRGTDLLALSPEGLRRVLGDDVAVVFQDPLSSLNPVLRMERQLTEGLRTHRGLSKAAARTEALQLLRLVGIPEPERRLTQYPHEYSGGMRQRAMIAMALACEPSLLIADEPTTALDVTVQAQILDLVRSLRDERSMAMIWVTHDLGVVAGIADRIAVMYAGEIVEEGPALEVFHAPRHPYTRGLLASIPRIDVDQPDDLPSIPGIPPALKDGAVGCSFRDRCPLREPVCDETSPPLLEVGAGHRAACHVTGRA